MYVLEYIYIYIIVNSHNMYIWLFVNVYVAMLFTVVDRIH